jgi:DNA repair protein RecO (recombination protein O)
VLHQRPYRDTSLIVELFTREHGRLSAFARAARGARSRFRGLQPFRPLLLSWVGRGEAPTLTAAEIEGVAPLSLAPDRLLSGFYLNELLLKLTVAHDPQPELYAHYAATLERLRALDPLDALLRKFEKRLLELLGYGIELGCEAQGGGPGAAGAGSGRAARGSGSAAPGARAAASSARSLSRRSRAGRARSGARGRQHGAFLSDGYATGTGRQYRSRGHAPPAARHALP